MSKVDKKSTESVNEKKSGEKVPQQSRSNGKTAKQIMNRHIKNKDDVITDEEFKNINISSDLSKDTAHEPLEIPENSDHPKDAEKDHATITPWDVIK